MASMKKSLNTEILGTIYPEIINKAGQAPVLLICEHASNDIPSHFSNLGLDEDVICSHAAWDPGAYEVACYLAELLDAPLIAGSVSRLLYDCNRPPEALDAIPERSEIYDIPGNARLTEEERQYRVDNIYLPYKKAVMDFIAENEPLRAVITVHSFTPIYNGIHRAVDVGILHDTDARLATELCAASGDRSSLCVRLNEPYSPEDGVTHTLNEFGVKNGLFNAMIEIKNNIVSTQTEAESMANLLALWTRTALSGLGVQLSKGEGNAPVH